MSEVQKQVDELSLTLRSLHEKLGRVLSQNPQLDEKSSTSSVKKTVFIRDDHNVAWTFRDGRVFTLYDLLVGTPDPGWYCASWEEAIAILNDKGYITGTVESVFPEEGSEIQTDIS